MFKNKIILITGGSGSWGNELATQLLKLSPKEIRIFSRGEISQVKMQRTFNNPKLKFIIGDVRNLDSLLKACEGVDYVFHMAALKHVPIVEEFIEEGIRTNIDGTLNIIEAAIQTKVKKVIDVSTDKAVVPVNTYGMTKAVGEKLIINADKRSKYTRFSVIRGGNALGSNGSVVPHFINQILNYNKVEITDERMTRYFLSLPEAVSLLLTATESSISGGVFVMKMPSFRILDIAKILIGLRGKKDTQIKTIGIRPGEKIHEVLVSQYESPVTYFYGDNYYLIHNTEQKLPKVNFTEYTSNTYLSIEKSDILLLLEKGKFL